MECERMDKEKDEVSYSADEIGYTEDGELEPVRPDPVQCPWVCPESGCGKRCGGWDGHPGPHQCPVHYRAVSWRSLYSHRVLVVAKQGGHPREWRAYIDAVPGVDHEGEWREVAAQGATLPRELAMLLFPSFAERFRYVG